MMNRDQLQKTLEFAHQALVNAGGLALRYFRQPLVVDNKLAGREFDPVTRADREVEAFLREQLIGRFPEIGVTGEEQGFTPGTGELNWVIDPIDGTKSFISGLPTWGMLLGLVDGEQVLGGMMHQPFTGELFTGGPEGAFLLQAGQRTVLRTRREARMDDAILFCTHESMFVDPAHLEAFHRISERSRLQRFGADCYAYCMLALGLVDLVVEDTLQPYDIIPLIPIIEAAGGTITDPWGRTPINGGFVVAAANPDLHRQALNLINL